MANRITAYRHLSGISGKVCTEIFNMTTRQKRAALKRLDILTATNCAWYLYEMRHVLRGFIEAATPTRRKRNA